jgi:hypothetical protein
VSEHHTGNEYLRDCKVGKSSAWVQELLVISVPVYDGCMDGSQKIDSPEKGRKKQRVRGTILRCVHHLVPHLDETFEENLHIMLCLHTRLAWYSLTLRGFRVS